MTPRRLHSLLLSAFLAGNLLLGAAAVPSSAAAAEEYIACAPAEQDTVSAQVYDGSSDPLPQTDLEAVRKCLQNTYLYDIPDEILQLDSIQEMIAAVKERFHDPYTRYVTAEEYEAFLDAINREYGGIGTVLDGAPGGVSITSVTPGSPAEEAGLLAGDLITAADGVLLAGMPVSEAAALLKGVPGTVVDLTVLRDGHPLHVGVTRAVIDLPQVTGELLDGHIGYIRIATMGNETTEQFLAAADQLAAEEADSYILDLRGNGGGYILPAFEIADFLLPPGSRLIGLGSKLDTLYLDSSTGPLWDPGKPVLLLVDRNTASAAEILTASLQDNHAVYTLGENTYGKGVGQSNVPLPEGGMLFLTDTEFIRASSGEGYNHTGLQPDLNLAALPADDWLRIAAMLLHPEAGMKDGDLRLRLGDQVIELSGESLRQEQNTAAFRHLLQKAETDSVELRSGSAWIAAGDEAVEKLWPLYYPGFKDMGAMEQVPLDKTFHVVFSQSMNPDSVTPERVRLVEKETGHEVPVTVGWSRTDELHIVPAEPLTAGTAYWLAVQPPMQSAAGTPLKSGAVLEVTTVD
ncbi:carboxyl-terminal protease [Paenibacillus mucilaginosus 3016]|uniref:Carboxyl-terminal protease n=1 Tax=Paenibacillus mucilaginosus 3016 TaxID=1116391 RepID=H6NIA2_9BACL|nr:S41 family peptidase [Paenibacillus mucilaginosus]AFC31505.1 carboxyl-terminal protease [Paenibacillus mucilaginosus 3016]WFA20047.1 PDZ domain-containing protein [Paenibacillus mucilaginosus]